MKINLRLNKAIKYYCEGETKNNWYASMVRAEYKERYAYGRGHELFEKVWVQEAIKQRQEAIEKAEKITIESVNADFEYAKDQCKLLRNDTVVLADRTNYVRICENQAKHVGFYKEDNLQRAEQTKLDEAYTEEAHRIANILNIEDARKGKAG